MKEQAKDISATYTGRIFKSTGSWYWIKTETGAIVRGRLRGKFKVSGLKVTNPIAVGDQVTYILEDEAEGTVMITGISDRINYLVRKSVHKTGHAHLIASNLDQAIVVTSLFMPRTSTGFIDRFVVSAESFGIPTVVIFNKTDLLEGEDLDVAKWLCSVYDKAGCRTILTSTVSGQGLDELKEILSGKTSLLSGHSGVGKSSLANALFPGLDLRTQEVSDFAEKGKHTTTFAEMFQIDERTYLIDTPGIKELGIAEIDNTEMAHFFPEMRALLGQCRFHNCQHINEPGCVVIDAVKAGRIAQTRYHSYLSMMSGDDNRR